MAYIGNSPSTITTGRQFVYEFTATAGQTVFTGADDNNQTLDLLDAYENSVYLNGIRLVDSDDFSISGDTLTLTSAASLNDVLVVHTQDMINNINSYTRAEADARYVNYNGDVIAGDISISGYLKVDGDTFYVDDSSNIVGIGITTPSTTAGGYEGGTLHIHNAGTGSSIRLTNSTTGTGASAGMLISKWSDSKTYFTNFDDGADMVFTPTNSGGNLVANTLVIKSDGNIGIGTGTPNQKLHVDGIIASMNSGQGAEQLQIQAYGSSGYINMNGSSDLIFRLGSSYSEKLRITSAGDVQLAGGGTIKSNGTADTIVLSGSTGVDVGGNITLHGNTHSNASQIFFKNGSTNVMTIAGGKVGIGEASPDYRLEVKGTATTNTDIVGFSNSNGTAKHIFGLENVGAGRYSIRDASNNTAVFFSAHDADNSYVNAGNFLVGTTNADVGGSVTGIALKNTGAILSSTDGTGLGAQPLYADRRGTNNEGDILMLALGGFYKSSIGVVGTNSGSNNGGITFNTIANNVTKTERVRIQNEYDRSIVLGNFTAGATGQYGIGQGSYNGRAYTWMYANANYGSSGVALGFDNAGTITPGLLLNNGGNVGINAANPVSKLDIQYGSLGTWEGASSTPTLTVGQNDAYRGIALRTVGDSNVGPSFHFERTRSSGGTTSDNDKLGQVDFNGSSGGYTDRISARIAVIQDGTAASGWVPGTIQFSTTSVAASSSNQHVTRMMIKTDGNIEFTNGGTRSQYIGYKDYAYYFDYQPSKQTWSDTTEAGNNALTHALMVRTPVRDASNVAAIVIAENGGQASGKNGLWFRNEDYNNGAGYTKAKIYTEVGGSYNATSFYIDVATSSRNSAQRLQIDHNGTFYGSSSNNISDRRLKENIETITNPIEKIKGLTGRTFMWTEQSTKADGKTKYGFIAQEVDTIVPDLVEKETGLTYFDDDDNIVEKHESTNAAMSVNETGVIPILVEALKEALTQIDDLKARIEALEG